ncbi:hypothetical protein [Lysobacter fragariae]
MTPEALVQRAEAFASWDCTPSEATSIVRGIETPQLADFLSEAHNRLDAHAKQWALGQPDVPNWIGAAHPRAPYELREKTQILEMEWRARHD